MKYEGGMHMKEQKDWFTGIDYYHNYKEKDIYINCLEIHQPIELQAHIQVELWYVLDGNAKIEINGKEYLLKKDAFLCIYAHHLYRVYDIQKPVNAIVIKFFIGMFMNMMWEKHEAGKNAELVYNTYPIIDGSCDCRIQELFKCVCKEKENQEFGSHNMMIYEVLELHTLFCRYALKNTDMNSITNKDIWYMIQRIILSPSSVYRVEDAAKELGYHPNYLNQRVKQLTGMTFLELRQFAKVLNACALLHFEELDISYIIEQLGYSSTATFYRIFDKYTGMSPMEYQQTKILDTKNYYHGKDMYLQIIQYIFINFTSPITIKDCARSLNIKEYTIGQLLQGYSSSFSKLLENIRFLYAKTLLEATDKSITTIAMDCGFGSTSTFQRVFLKKKNCTPSAYRKKFKNL